jgi:hypothetical protein
MGRRLAEALTNRAMRSEDKKASRDTVTERKLAPTLRWEGLLLAETAGHGLLRPGAYRNRHIPYGMRILQRLCEGKGTRAAGPACWNGTIAARGRKGAR